jgi:hypothetical protein
MWGLIGRRHTGRVSDAPAYRIWPPAALGVPLLVGIVITATAGDPVELPVAAARLVGGVLLVAFALWNGSALLLLARHRTALLPGGSTRVILDRGRSASAATRFTWA